MQKVYQLHNVNPDYFLQTIWQIKPCLLKNALPKLNISLAPEELAGLACDEDVESRIITLESGDWQLEHGPFAEDSFPGRPNKDWTLLVQAVDHYVPEVAELLEYFRFIPNWRIDDIMVSFAATGGSVGPHFDQYDVFLVQGSGTREWRIGQHCNETTPLLDHPELSLLKDFQETETFIAEPGDIVYIPPGIAHWGISQSNDCMTYSVGFRAPSHSEIISYFCDHLVDHLKHDPRYKDKAPIAASSPGEISTDVVEHLSEIIQSITSDKDTIGRWFGEFMTLPKYPAPDTLIDIADEQLENLLSNEESLYREPAARFAYRKTGQNVELFINGDSFALDSSLLGAVMHLCDNSEPSCSPLTPLLSNADGRTVLLYCFQHGYLSAE